MKLEFDFIRIAESRNLKTESLSNNILSYPIIQLLYINKKHSYKFCPDQTIDKAKNLNKFLLK